MAPGCMPPVLCVSRRRVSRIYLGRVHTRVVKPPPPSPLPYDFRYIFHLCMYIYLKRRNNSIESAAQRPRESWKKLSVRRVTSRIRSLSRVVEWNFNIVYIYIYMYIYRTPFARCLPLNFFLIGRTIARGLFPSFGRSLSPRRVRSIHLSSKSLRGRKYDS